ncbi:hypothetical protein P879_05230 [Paragonimus westermani]|uniref:NOT2/NOT3/NOT5 C-terminal domain-containing protein n=1 Tax=Paragonimus westermani TaxID=34504 RepID=A0A8T0DC42_9TREM|nr:hypothetical protein P879_05230 [Paragonimus westermani]
MSSLPFFSYQREWRFHKKEQIWLTRIIGANFTTDSSSEQGDYYFWDPLKAQKSTHQMTILYSDLDDAPRAFRLSSGTLSAFVSIGLPAGTATGHHSIGPHSHSGSHSALQQQHLAAYQQQHQQQYSQQQSLLTRQQLSTVASLSNVASSPQQPSGQMMALQGVTPITGNLGAPSAATLANLFNARQQQHKQQLSPTTSYFQTSSSHGRAVSVAPRSASTAAGPSVTPSTSPATTTGVTSMAANTLASTSPNSTSANPTNGSSNVVDLAIDSDTTLSRMANSLSIADAGGVQPVFENARL